MKHVRRLWHRLLGSFTGSRKDDDLARELDAHIQLMTDDLVARGVAPGDARRQALLAFGGVELTKEHYRDQRGLPSLDAVRQDVVFAWRTWRRNPGVAAIAVLSLAIGLAANTAVFGLMNGVLLKALPVRDPGQLRVLLWAGQGLPVSLSGRLDSDASGWTVANAFSADAYRRFRDRVPELTDVVALSQMPRVTALGPGDAFAATGLLVSGNFFGGLGVSMRLGRAIAPSDDRVGADAVVVVSHQYWREKLRGDPGAVGHTILLNRASFTVVGVLAPEFRGVMGNVPTDLYVPLSAQPLLRKTPWESPDFWTLQVIARMRPGADERRAVAAASALFNNVLPASDSKPGAPRKAYHILLADGSRGFQYSVREPIPVLWMLAGSAAIVLLVACANVAGLQLLKGAAREQELAIRMALGAGRWRLARHTLTESLLLALAGGGLGLLLAAWGTTMLSWLLWPAETALDLGLDRRVFLFVLVLSAVAALLAGLLPALRTARRAPAVGLAGRSSRVASRLRGGRSLVAVQVGLSLLLLVGAGLFARTLVNLYAVPTGFDPANVLVFSLDATAAGYKGTAAVDVYERILAGIGRLPGVRAVAHSNFVMLSGWMSTWTADSIPGRPADRPRMQVLGLSVSERFFSTMGLPVVRGRGFAASDDDGAPTVLAVNETFARAAFPNEDPIGRVIPARDGEGRIVGVIRDMTYVTLKEPPQPTVFSHYRQAPRQVGTVHFEVRTAGHPMAVLPAVRKLVSGVDRRIPVSNPKTQAAQLDESIGRERGLTWLVTGLAAVAVLLSCIGLYGVMAYHVARRTGEIGIRMALGCTAVQIVRPILRGALLMVVAGVAIGLPAVLAAGRVVRQYLFGVDPMDPLIIAGAILLLVLVAAAGTLVPARRAARVDPAIALRCE